MRTGSFSLFLFVLIFSWNIYRISETSIESFVIRVFRERNREGFIKAFSENPEQLQNGFGKLERLMKMLFIRKLYLWPRFRREVDTQLDRNQPDVIELSLPLTPAMKAIQSAVLVAMNTCMSELRKSVPQLETSSMTPLLTLENGLFQSFDRTLRNQLDADWHKISYKAKQLVTDLSTLRKLLDYLIRYDAFSFYYLLLKLQSASSEQASPSLWYDICSQFQ
jgi:DNA excision repair protein ERCC-4